MSAATAPEDERAAAPGRAGFPFALLFAGAVGAALAHLGAVAMPFQIGAVMDALAVSPEAAGIFGFCQMGALALAMILSAPAVDRLPPAMLAIGGAILAAAANLAMFQFVPGLWLLCVLAMLAGAGYGAVFAATIAGISSSPFADRLFALSSGGSVMIVVALMAWFPTISVRFGTMGPFVGIGALVLATSPFLLGFGWQARARAAATGPASPVRSRGAIAIYVIWACFSLASGVAWSFAERIGRSIGLDPATIGAILSASTFAGIGGTLVAAAIAGRWPRLVSATIGLVGTGLGCLLFSIAGGAALFASGALLFWVASMFFYCVMLGTAAAYDPSGRVGTSGGGFDRLGFACGPALGGLILGHFSFAALGIAAFGICLSSGLYGLPILRQALARR